MRISTKGRYALRLMVDLAVSDNGQYISLRDVAQRQGISMKYMEQIVSLLTKQGMLNSVRGPQGGYRLARPASEYGIGDILRASEGELELVTCLGEEYDCTLEGDCYTKAFWEALQNCILSYADSISLQDLVNGRAMPRYKFHWEDDGEK